MVDEPTDTIDPTTIPNDPDYQKENLATKQAIFQKWVASDPDYLKENDDTKRAIQQRYGVAPPDDSLGNSAKVAVRSAAEYAPELGGALVGGAIRGATVGLAGGPAGVAAGALSGAAYGVLAHVVADLAVKGYNYLTDDNVRTIGQYIQDKSVDLGIGKNPETATERVVDAVTSGALGAATFATGASAVGKGIQAAAKGEGLLAKGATKVGQGIEWLGGGTAGENAAIGAGMGGTMQGAEEAGIDNPYAKLGLGLVGGLAAGKGYAGAQNIAHDVGVAGSEAIASGRKALESFTGKPSVTQPSTAADVKTIAEFGREAIGEGVGAYKDPVLTKFSNAVEQDLKDTGIDTRSLAGDARGIYTDVAQAADNLSDLSHMDDFTKRLRYAMENGDAKTKQIAEIAQQRLNEVIYNPTNVVFSEDAAANRQIMASVMDGYQRLAANKVVQDIVYGAKQKAAEAAMAGRSFDKVSFLAKNVQDVVNTPSKMDLLSAGEQAVLKDIAAGRTSGAFVNAVSQLGRGSHQLALTSGAGGVGATAGYLFGGENKGESSAVGAMAGVGLRGAGMLARYSKNQNAMNALERVGKSSLKPDAEFNSVVDPVNVMSTLNQMQKEGATVKEMIAALERLYTLEPNSKLSSSRALRPEARASVRDAARVAVSNNKMRDQMKGR